MTLRTNIQLLVAALAAAALGAALTRVDPPLAAVCAAAAVFAATLASATTWSVERLGYGFLAAAMITITWNGVTVTGGGSPGTSASSVTALAPADVLLAPAIVLLAVHAVTARVTIRYPGWLVIGGGLMLATAILAEVFPPHFSLLPFGHEGFTENLVNLVKFETALVVVPLTLMVAGTNSDRITRLADLWAMSAILSALVASSDHVGLTDLGRTLTGLSYPEGRENGLTFQPNHLATASVMTLPLVLTWVTRGRAWIMTGVVSTGVLLTGVLASGSRAGAGAAAVAVVLTVASVPRLRRAVGRGALVAGLVVIVLLPTTAELVGDAATQVRLGPAAASETALSDMERAQAAERAKQEFNERPVFGVGFAVVYRAHNIYLQLLAAGGVIALAAFVIYIAGVLRIAAAALRTSDRTLAVALSAAVIAWLAAGAVSNQLVDRYAYVPIGLLMAIALLTERIGPGHANITALPRLGHESQGPRIEQPSSRK